MRNTKQFRFQSNPDGSTPFASFRDGKSPVVATAIHDGHELRSEIRPYMALDEATRLREEDPYTGRWTSMAANRAIAHHSRFEVDLNRPRDQAVYQKPGDAWGLEVWKKPLPREIIETSLDSYDGFYDRLEDMLARLVAEFGAVVVLDLHTYNYLRDGAEGVPADPETNPEVNVGTGSLDRRRWAHVVDHFIEDLRSVDFLGRRLDVRENVRFRGGHMSRWMHAAFPESACCLAIEVKKFFMNEWTGEADDEQLEAIGRTLEYTVSGLLDELSQKQR